MEHRCTKLANKVLEWQDKLPKTKNSIEIKYRATVLSLCREITEGPVGDEGQFAPDTTTMD
jgi:hypothetical protein